MCNFVCVSGYTAKGYRGLSGEVGLYEKGTSNIAPRRDDRSVLAYSLYMCTHIHTGRCTTSVFPEITAREQTALLRHKLSKQNQDDD